MASTKNAARQAREAKERLRRYNARQAVHAHRSRRARRDNIMASIGLVIIVALATVTQVLYFTAGPGLANSKATPSASPAATPSPQAGTNVGDVPDPSLAENRTWTGELVLNDVTLQISLDGAAAPQTVSAFIQGARDGYFTGKSCHRLTDEGAKLIQCGSLDGSGASDPSFSFGPIENAPADGKYPAGTIAMARAGDNAYSQGHQFFIMYEDGTLPADSAGGYTIFGQVTAGLDQFVSAIAAGGIAGGAHDGAPVVPTTITRVSVE